MRLYNLINNFLKYSPLLIQLVKSDLSKKYRRSVLGYAWSLLNPIFMMIVISFVFSNLFNRSIENFPIYLILGQTIWLLHSETSTGAMKSINLSSALLKKIYVPKYIFPFSKALFALINSVFSILAVFIVIIFTRTPITWTVLFFPLPMIYTLVFSTGFGLILCVFDVRFKDTEHLYGVALLAWMYLSAIFYPASNLPHNVQRAIQFNPMYQFINYMRTVILYNRAPTLRQNMICLASSGLIFIAGLFLFYKKQDDFMLYL